MDSLLLDAETLFSIAEIIEKYCDKQREILTEYYNQILSLQSEWIDDETFGVMAEKINKLKNDVISISEEINKSFPQYFREKAQKILNRPTMQTPVASGLNALTVSIHEGYARSLEYFSSFPAESSKVERQIPRILSGVDSLELGQNIISADNVHLSDTDKKTFKDGKYETYRISEPLTVYRYFGSYTPEEMSNISETDLVQTTESALNDVWGADAGGRFLALNPDLTSEQARDLLALKPEWGNNAAYIATIELPIGTQISIGKAAMQKCANGKILHGGETQIIIHEEWTTEKIRMRVKSCKPIEN